MILAKKMITKLTKTLGCDGYNIVRTTVKLPDRQYFIIMYT